MRQSWRVYLVAAIVLVLSFVAAWTLPTTDFFRGILGLPGVAALIGALYQILRDQAAHERELELQGKQQLFSLGVATHMADVAFDKHVQFSEQYISRMQQGLTELFQRGPAKESLKFCSDLADTRLAFRAWITKDLESKLMPFEDALRRIGASNIVLEGLPPGEERTRVVDKMYQVFCDVLGLRREGKVDEEVAPREVISHLQELLGVQQLSRFRTEIIRAAIDSLERKG